MMLNFIQEISRRNKFKGLEELPEEERAAIIGGATARSQYAESSLSRYHAQVEIPKTKKEPKQDLAGLYACHLTKFAPKGGVIYPRIYIKHEAGPDYKKISDFLSVTRPTIHFTVQHLVEKHMDYQTDHSDSFLIMVPLAKMKGRVAGGYIEDIFVLGPFALPKGTIILAHKNCAHEFKDLPEGIEVKTYAGDIYQAFVTVLSSKNSAPLSLIEGEATHVLYDGIIDDSLLTSSALMNMLGAPLRIHERSLMGDLESFLRTFSPSIRGDKVVFPRKYNIKNFLGVIDEFAEGIRTQYREVIDPLSIDRWVSVFKLGLWLLYTGGTKDNLLKYHDNLFLSRFRYYDQFCIDRPAPECFALGALDIMNSKTSLDFKLYFHGDRRDFLFNAICVLSDSQASNGSDVAKKLSSTFGLPFVVVPLNNKSCVILRNINYPAVINAINASKDTGIELS